MATRLNLTLTEVSGSANIASNKSKVRALLTITTDGGTYNQSGDTSGSLRVNDASYSLDGKWIYINTTTTLFDQEIEIQHDADGRKTVTASASFDVNTSVRWIYASASLELTRIPRASTLVFDSVTLGEAVDITIERADDSFRDTITFSFGSEEGTIVNRTPTKQPVMWTPSVELAAQIPNSASGTGVFTVTTYDADGVEIGSKPFIFTATVPAYVKPSATAELSDEKGYRDTYGGYVQHQSRLTVQASGTGICGSTIDAWQITIGDVSYAAESVTIDLLTSNAALPIKVAVHDTRDRWSDEFETTINVMEYSFPTVTQIIAGRYDPESEAMADDGTQVAVKFSADITSLGGQNSATFHVKLREKGATSWTTAESLDSEGYTPEDVLVVMDSDTTRAYELMVTAEDNFSSRDSVIRSVPIAFVFFHWSAVRRAFAFFQKAVEDATFRIAEGMAVRLPKDTKVDERSVVEHFDSTENPHGVTPAQIYALPAIESTDYPGCFYRMVGGVQEWLNPPMVIGVEYRTTERYNGKPVYWKLVDFGALPDATCRQIRHGISNVEDNVFTACSARNASGSSAYIPSSTGDTYNSNTGYIELTWACGATETWVYITTNANRTSWTGRVFVKVTKTTD